MNRPAERMPLSRDRVLRKALELVDQGGLDRLSMRRLGQELDVEAMSLYNHVRNKEDLLDGIVDLVWTEIQLPKGEEDWKADIARCAVSAYEALRRHPWAPNLIMGHSRVRPSRIQYMEALMHRLREAGFSPETTYHAYHALDSHILGFTLWQAGHGIPRGAAKMVSREDMALFFAAALPEFRLADFPYLMEHAELHLTEGSHKEEREFEFGLSLILESLQRIRDSEQAVRLVAVRRRV